MENRLRLRLVVRRHALPEVRVVFTVSLENDATIANLLEQVNETIPLESDTWGLEDYVVELRDPEGQTFECLHFQPISAVLEKDEEVFIRPLFPRDRKKRVLSGRHQISLDGRHLIDGIPFGRPLLKPPRERPAIEIPPLKRRRIDYNLGSDDEDLEDVDDDRPLYLTEKGEKDGGSSHTGSSVLYEGLDSAEDEDYYEGGTSDDADEGDFDMGSVDEQDLDEELRELQKESAEFGAATSARPLKLAYQDLPAPVESEVLDLPSLDKLTALRKSFPDASVSICEKMLLRFNKDETKAYMELSRTYKPQLSISEMLASGPPNRAQGSAHEEENSNTSDAESVDTVVKRFDHHGFPSGSILSGRASTIVADNLRKGGYDVQDPKHTRFVDNDGVISSPNKHDQEDPGATTDDSSGSNAKPESEPESESESESEGQSEDESESDTDSESESDHESAPGAHGADGSVVESDSDTSSSPSDSDDDSGPEVASSRKGVHLLHDASPNHSVGSDDSHSSGPGTTANDTGTSDGNESSDSDSAEDDSSGDDSSEDDSSSDTESSVIHRQLENSQHDLNKPGSGTAGKGTGRTDNLIHEAGTSSSGTESSDDSSDDESEGSNSSESSSDNDSSEESSSGESSSDDEDDSDSRPAKRIKTVTTSETLRSAESQHDRPAVSSVEHVKGDNQKSAVSVPGTNAQTVLPGQGKTSTKSRNARKRARKAAAKEAEATVDAALLARKAALLASLASPGHATEPENEAEKEAEKGAEKDAEKDAEREVEKNAANHAGKENVVSPENEELSLTSSQRRLRLDVAAGRRMLFGALGLRNPKTRADEDKISADLMKNVRPHINRRLTEGAGNAAADGDPEDQQPVQEDPEAWRDKITYRAVECCHEGIELSEPPFPFIQRWDPQQQGRWVAGKTQQRGGRMKRKQRSQPDFYEEEQPGAKRGKFATDDADADAIVEPHSTDIILNYDDEGDDGPSQDDEGQHMPHRPVTEQSQATDAEDLPSLPDDLSKLVSLEPGQAQQGMVITWRQLFLSDCQPQILSVTGMVVEAAPGNASLTVVLARRDRSLGRKAKKYDDQGRRIYDRFDAPDSDDGEGEAIDDGYRTLEFSDMMEPRIVQQPISSVLDDLPEQPNSQPVSKPADDSASRSASGDHSTTLDHDEPRKADDKSGQASSTDTGAVESIIPDSIVSRNTDGPQPTHSFPVHGSRENQVPESSGIIACSNSQIYATPRMSPEPNSPSRQLEETSEAAAVVSKPSSIPPLDSSSAVYSGGPLLPAVQPGSAAGPGGDAGSDAVEDKTGEEEESASTPRGRPRVLVTSSASSARSGRQPDPDYSIDLGIESWDRFEDTMVDGPVVASESTASRSNDHVDRTPTKPANSAGAMPAAVSAATAPALLDSPASSSSFPSPSQIFLKAGASRSAHSPLQKISSAAAKKVRAAPDKEYEEAMRLLDEGNDGSDNENGNGDGNRRNNGQIQVKQEVASQSEKNISRAKRLLEQPINKPAPRSLSRRTSRKVSDSAEMQPGAVRSPSPPRRTSQRFRASRAFTIPEGSQVVSLLSSSPEPEFTEHYADDSIDETYDEVKGGLAGRFTMKKERGVSVPAASVRKSSTAKRLPSTQRTSSSGRPATKPTPFRTNQASGRSSM